MLFRSVGVLLDQQHAHTVLLVDPAHDAEDLGHDQRRQAKAGFVQHPYKQQVLHVDFQRVDKTHKIHVKVPLHFLNEETAPGVKTGGGKISHVITEIDITCLPGNLPEYIAVDVGQMELNQSIHVAELQLPEGVELVAHLVHENPAVVALTLPKGMKSDDEPSAETPAATPPAKEKE